MEKMNPKLPIYFILPLFLGFSLLLPSISQTEEPSLAPDLDLSSAITLDLDKELVTIEKFHLRSKWGVTNIQGQIKNILSRAVAKLEINFPEMPLNYLKELCPPELTFLKNLVFSENSSFTSRLHYSNEPKVESFIQGEIYIQEDEIDLPTYSFHLQDIQGKVPFVQDIPPKEKELNQEGISPVRMPVSNSNGANNFFIQKIQWKGVQLQDVHAGLSWQNSILNLKGISGTLFHGQIKGEGRLFFRGKSPEYELNFTFQDLNMKEISQIINPERLAMKGTLQGQLKIGGKGKSIDLFEGEFTTAPGGGRIVIKEMEKIIDKVPAQLDSKSVKLLLKLMEDYHYTKGKISLSLEEDQTLKTHLYFEGKEGKRDIELYLHDLFKP